MTVASSPSWRKPRLSASMLCVSLLLVVTAGSSVRGQEAREKRLGFDVDRFQAVEDTVAWLLEYDRVAWIASDSVAAVAEAHVDRLGREWFCYERHHRWHAVFGRFDPESDEYVAALRFVEDSSSRIRRLEGPSDSARLTAYARSLYHSRSLLPPHVTERPGAFNQYVRDRSDGRIEVRYLPAGLPHAMILQGPEYHFVFGQEGRNLAESNSVEAELRGMFPDTARVLDINNEARAIPTVGQVFFVRRFGSSFRRVRIWNRRFITSLVEGRWVHVLKEMIEESPDWEVAGHLLTDPSFLEEPEIERAAVVTEAAVRK